MKQLIARITAWLHAGDADFTAFLAANPEAARRHLEMWRLS